MMKNFMVKNFIIIFSGLMLFGCGESKIEVVKKSTSRSPDYTYGQILDNRVDCDEKNWQLLKDNNQRDLVVFSCKFKLPSDQIEDIKKNTIERINQQVKSLETRIQDTEEKLRLTLSVTLPQDGRAVENSKDELARFVESPRMTREDFWRRNIVEKITFRDLPQSQLDKIADERIAEKRKKDQQEIEAKIVAYQTVSSEMTQRAIAKQQQLQSYIDKTNEIKPAYLDQLQKIKIKDELMLSNFPFKSYLLESKKYFLVLNGQVKQNGNEFYINEKIIEMNLDDKVAMSFSMELLTITKGEKIWWQKQVEKQMNLEISTFPYVCDFEKGCSGK